VLAFRRKYLGGNNCELNLFTGAHPSDPVTEGVRSTLLVAKRMCGLAAGHRARQKKLGTYYSTLPDSSQPVDIVAALVASAAKLGPGSRDSTVFLTNQCAHRHLWWASRSDYQHLVKLSCHWRSTTTLSIAEHLWRSYGEATDACAEVW